MGSSCLPQIFHIQGKFLVFDKDHAVVLRTQRIVGHLIGPSSGSSQQIVTSSLPYYIGLYAANLAYELKLATFFKLVKQEDSSIEQNLVNFKASLSDLQEKSKGKHFERRQTELRRRNIEPNEVRLGLFDESRVRLSVDAIPVTSQSSYRPKEISEDELRSIFDRLPEGKKKIVYRDLYQKGFYVTSGAKFGCDILAYLGDPVVYHAKFALRIVPNGIDLSRTDINELNALHRLCHAANKIVLLVEVSQKESVDRVKYWSIKTKEYLSPGSRSALVECPILGFDSHDGVPSYHDHSKIGTCR